MRIALDTNVLVAALLSPFGTPAQVLALLLAGRAQLCYDARIMNEYREVLRRPKFAFDVEAVGDLLDYLEDTGTLAAGTPWPAVLPDADDAMFLEVAKAAAAACLVTGNLRHFPARARRGVTVVTPARFIAGLIP
jgi:putative PIN family toxin of toxin-antitoxin system